MQNDTNHPIQPPLGCLRHRTHFSRWKADSDTASSNCVSSGSPSRRDIQHGWEGNTTDATIGSAHLEPTFCYIKRDVRHGKVNSDSSKHNKCNWSIMKNTQQLRSVQTGGSQLASKASASRCGRITSDGSVTLTQTHSWEKLKQAQKGNLLSFPLLPECFNNLHHYLLCHIIQSKCLICYLFNILSNEKNDT